MWRAIKIGAILVAIGGLALLGLMQWREERKSAEMRAEARRHNAEQMRQATARAQACIDDVARRDPAADVASDIARGDPTPIGIGYMPHEGNESIHYPAVEACRYAGERSEDAGKEMRHTGFGFSHWPAPNQRGCEEAARRYAAAYNSEMLRRAPGAVASFCRTHIDPEAEPIRFRP